MPILWKENKRLLIIRMFEKLGGGKDITAENNSGRSRYAWTARYISWIRFPASTFERGCNIVHVFRMGTCREFFRLYGDALITKSVLMQLWLNH